VIAWVRSLFNRESGRAKTRLANSGSALPDQSIWEQFQRIGGSLTPAQVSQILRDADAGRTECFVDLLNESRQKDCHLQSVLFARESSLSGLKWELHVEGSTKKKPKGQRQIRFIEQCLRGHPGLPDLFGHLVGGAYYGYAVAETDFKLNARGQIVPRAFVRHSARRFGFRMEDGRLVWRDHTTGLKDVDFREEFPRKFIVSQPRITGDVEIREGLGRILVWPALFRNWTISDWLKLAELAWKPWRLGEYQKGADKEDIDLLEAMCRQMVASGSAVHPHTVKLNLVWPGGGSGGTKPGHSDLFDRMGSEMSKAVLGQTLTTEQGRVGSQALGTVHEGVKKAIRDFDAENVAAVITRDLIRPLIEMNFGPGAVVPEFRFVTRDSADLKMMAEAVKILGGKDVQLRIGADWVRDECGIPEPDDDDELVGVHYDVDLSGLDDKPENDPPEGEDDKPDAEGDEAEDEAA
jgi:phage gp29-like protein